jgi:branched-chain amino acid transport system substrate-binding protein
MGRFAAALLVLLALLAVSCGGESVDAVESSTCAEVLYEGEGEPDAIVVSDFPRRGIGAEATQLMIDAIELVFRQREFRAGERRVGYQSCNDTQGDDPFDPILCRRNARDYVATKDVLGIIGPYNSGCAFEQIPIVSRRAAGPLAMISPSNTFLGLTRAFDGPSGLYPDGVRSYARVVTHDTGQGSAAAHLIGRLGARRVALVRQDSVDRAYVRGLAQPFLAAAQTVGLDVVQFDWPVRKTYEALADSVAAARPDAVFLAGLTQGNAKRLVEDLRAALPQAVTLVGPDSFAAEGIAGELGPAGEGMLVTEGGIPPEKLPPAGQRFLREFRPSGHPLYAPEAAQAAGVLLDAIARSDGTRASVVDEVFATKVENGILGSFSFDRYGDIVPAPVGIYRVENGELVAHDVVRAPVDAIGD